MSTLEMLRRYIDASDVPDATFQKVADISQMKTFDADAIIYREQENSDHLFIVLSGQVDVQYLLPSGRRTTVDVLKEGDYLVWSALVPPHTTESIGICRAHSELLAIPGPALRDICEEDTLFGLRLMTAMARVIRRRLRATRMQLVDAS